MAEAFFKVLIENLASLIQKEVGLVMGVDNEMKKLSSTLSTIQAVLADAEDKQLQSEPIQNWLSKLNDIAFEVEDILDVCATEYSKLMQKGSIFHLKKILFSLKIGRRMKEMAEKLDAVAAERNFHLREIVVPQWNKVDVKRETGFILNEPDHIYGRDEDAEKIVDILVNQVAHCQELSVLPIFGVGGLGKTTFAQLVYNDPRMSEHFEVRLWVCVSDNFDLKILLKAMIESATGSRPDLVHLAALQDHLWKVLTQKRYLLILDDVWNDDQEEWAKLKSILACGSEGASIVVTTRQEKVANIMRTLPAHCLNKLSEEHCWLLFRLRAFGQENEEHPNLETIGRQIVKKSAGVPLVAKALGGLLRFTRKEEEWIHVRESEIWNLPTEENSILSVLRLSYQRLPLVLKRCFVYCAVFRKGRKIEKQNLIFHWMAHGCISSNRTQDVEDAGDKIWHELVLRSFFQEVGTNYEGQTTFKMHDLIHDLAQSIMENKIPGAQTRSSSASASTSKIREVYMREYSVTRSSSIALEVSTLTSVMNYNRLRILKLNGKCIEELPSATGKLKHLRYLDLSFSPIRILPRTICDLWNLQILILNHCFRLKSLPKHIRCMTNLRHIFLKRCVNLSNMPPRIGELKNLKTLSLFIIGEEKGNHLDELEHLNLGGRLEIKHLERIPNHTNAEKANLAKKSNLRDLVLYWGRCGDRTSESAKMKDKKVLEALEPHPTLETLEINGFEGSHFPLWMTKRENLTKITIRHCPNCSRLPPLGELPQLKSLTLWNLDALEYISEDEIRGQTSVRANFPSLEALELHRLPNLKGLSKEEMGEYMFPNLQRLKIDVSQLLIFPFSKFGNIPSLHLDFDGITRTYNIPEERLEDLCNLKELRVDRAGEYCLPEKWYRGLKSLTKLQIFNSHTARIPEGWLRHLTAVEELQIFDCRKLVEVPEEIQYLHLLKRLVLFDLNNLVSLPQGLQHLPSLQSLALFSLPQLTSLPEWLGNLTSLTHLSINYCPKVPSLPSSIRGITNLSSLYISRCPQLARRCEREKGEDWHKIAHIPGLYISVDWRFLEFTA